MAENVKAYAGAAKPALGLIPPVFKIQLSLALLFGARKYGRRNWAVAGVAPIRASTYVSAMQRHLDAYAAGEETASDSGVHHLAHLAASCAIILDAVAAGRFNDDRVEAIDLEAHMADAAKLIASWPPAKHEVHG